MGRAQESPRAGDVLDRLRDALGPLEKPRLPPLDELILTILSQSTTDRNRDRAWESLRRRFPTWNQVRQATAAELEQAIRVAGLAKQKARSIRAALVRLETERGELSLDHLASLSDREALDYLTGFEGVGLKTAACVLCFSLKRAVLPIDTHVLRVARRFRWVPSRCSADRAHGLVEGRVPGEDRFEIHLALIGLGRRWCAARAPRCEECPLFDLCPREGL